MESLYNLVKELYSKIQSEHYSNIMITKIDAGIGCLNPYRSYILVQN